jgi:Domain of unknown function (DUF4276)
MTFLHVLAEELSIKIVLDILLPSLLPNGTLFRVYSYNGKDDLQKAIQSVVPSLSRTPGAVVLIIRDQDQYDCIALKQELMRLTYSNCSTNFKIRIVCRELEAWYLGDMDAVELAYPRFKADQYKNKSDFRDVDSIVDPVEKLRRLIPDYSQQERLPKLEIAQQVAVHMQIDRNRSTSFQHFFRAVTELINGNETL